VKNKVAPPFKEAEFDIMYGEGISKEGCILDVAVERDLVDKSGSWFSYNGQRIGQGKDNARQYLKDNPDLAQEIEQLIRSNVPLIETAVDDSELLASDDSDILGIDV
jgi:recombination protein RecA